MFSDKSLSVLALVISLIAMALTGVQSFLAFEHNRVSVSPKLDWRFDSDDDYAFRIRLVNVGLGPAIVRNPNLYIGETSLGPLGNEACAKIDSYLDLGEVDHSKSACFTMERGEELYMRPDEEIVLFQIGPSLSNPQKWVETGKSQAIGVFAEYCSLYEVCQILE